MNKKSLLALLGLGLTGASFLVGEMKDNETERQRNKELKIEIDKAVKTEVQKQLADKSPMFTIINGGKSEP